MVICRAGLLLEGMEYNHQPDVVLRAIVSGLQKALLQRFHGAVFFHFFVFFRKEVFGVEPVKYQSAQMTVCVQEFPAGSLAECYPVACKSFHPAPDHNVANVGGIHA